MVWFIPDSTNEIDALSKKWWGFFYSTRLYLPRDFSSGSSRTMRIKSILIPKLLEIEKEIVREVARGDKPYLRKSTDRKAQISPLNWTNAFLICALRYVDFLR